MFFTKVPTVFPKVPIDFPKVLTVFLKVLTVFSKVLSVFTDCRFHPADRCITACGTSLFVLFSRMFRHFLYRISHKFIFFRVFFAKRKYNNIFVVY